MHILWLFKNFNSDLSKVLKVCHSLPTSSSSLEQSFSRLKFIKNNLRSNIKEETLQSLLLITQKYQNQKEIVIPKKIIQAYDIMKQTLTQRKSNNKENEKRKLDSFLSWKEEEDVDFISKTDFKNLKLNSENSQNASEKNVQTSIVYKKPPQVQNFFAGDEMEIEKEKPLQAQEDDASEEFYFF